MTLKNILPVSNIFGIILIFTIVSCSGAKTTARQKKLEGAANEYGQVISYFLPDIPRWVNFSEEGQCFRTSDVQFLNFQALNASYGYDFPTILELQGVYNQKIQDLLAEKNLTFEERISVLYESIENIAGGIRYADIPRFNKFQLLWIDNFQSDSELKKWLEGYSNDEKYSDYVPIIFSYCLTRKEIEHKLEELNLDQVFPYNMGAEVLTIYNENIEEKPHFKFYFHYFFKKDDKIELKKREGIEAIKNSLILKTES